MQEVAEDADAFEHGGHEDNEDEKGPAGAETVGSDKDGADRKLLGRRELGVCGVKLRWARRVRWRRQRFVGRGIWRVGQKACPSVERLYTQNDGLRTQVE